MSCDSPGAMENLSFLGGSSKQWYSPGVSDESMMTSNEPEAGEGTDSVGTPASDHDGCDSFINGDSKDSSDGDSDGHRNSNINSNIDSDINSDTNSDSDINSDINSDTKSVSDSDINSNSSSDINSDTNSDTNSDSDIDSDSDTDSDTDSDNAYLYMLCLAILYCELSDATKMVGVMPGFHWYRDPDDETEHTCHYNNPKWKPAGLTLPNVFVPAHVKSVRVAIKASPYMAYQKNATDSGYSAISRKTGQAQLIMLPAFQRGSSPDGREYMYYLNKDISAASHGNESTEDRHFKVGEIVHGTLEVYDDHTDICLAQSAFQFKLQGSIASSDKPPPSRARHVYSADDLHRLNHHSPIPSSTRIESTATDLQ